MSQFNQRMALADDALFQDFRESVLLSPEPLETPISIQHAIVSDETVMEQSGEGVNQLIFKRILAISTDPASPRYCGIEKPIRKGTFTVGENEYQIHQISRDSFGMAYIEGRRHGMLAVQRQNHEGSQY
jgi:hypothetical protein